MSRSSVPPAGPSSQGISRADFRTQVRELILQHLTFEGGHDKPELSKSFPDGTTIYFMREYRDSDFFIDLAPFDPKSPNCVRDLDKEIARMESLDEGLTVYSMSGNEPMLLNVSKNISFSGDPEPRQRTRKRILGCILPPKKH